jgi:transcriptional regulator with XRE-family HTH domain
MASLGDRLKQLGAEKKRGWQAALARHCGVKPPSVADWLSGKSKSLEGENLLRAAEFFNVNPEWLANGKGVKWRGDAATAAHEAHEPSPSYAVPSFAPLHSPSIDEAVEKIAELLAGINAEGRERASTVLSNLVKNPSRPADAAQKLAAVMVLYPRDESEPEPTPPAGRGKRRTAAAERRDAPRPQLTVTAGGGQKMQLDLPLKKALEPPRDPFDEKNAPANERLWYEKVKAAPKAKT